MSTAIYHISQLLFFTLSTFVLAHLLLQNSTSKSQSQE